MTTLTEGSIVPKVHGPYIPQSSLKHDEFCQRARENPDNSVLVERHYSEQQTKAVRMRRRAPYRTPEGRIRISLINSVVEDGVRYGDMYFTWEPAKVQS